MKEIFKSPVLHFIVIGVTLYFAYKAIEPASKKVISVSSQTIEAMVQGQADLQQAAVNQEQRSAIVRSHVEDEILFRVAIEQGLDKSDYRVRKRVLSLIRASLTEVVPEPTYAQLKAYYQENSAQLQGDTTWSYDQVFFNINNPDLPNSNQDYIKFLNEVPNTERLGDFMSIGGGKRTKIAYSQMAATYGKDFAESIKHAPMQEWYGPVNSKLGLHYLKKLALHEPELPPFEQIEDYLRQDYTFRKTRDLQEQKIIELARQFNIIVEGEPYTF